MGLLLSQASGIQAALAKLSCPSWPGMAARLQRSPQRQHQSAVAAPEASLWQPPGASVPTCDPALCCQNARLQPGNGSRPGAHFLLAPALQTPVSGPSGPRYCAHSEPRVPLGTRRVPCSCPTKRHSGKGFRRAPWRCPTLPSPPFKNESPTYAQLPGVSPASQSKAPSAANMPRRISEKEKGVLGRGACWASRAAGPLP